MHKTLTPEDWIDQGYKKFTSTLRPLAAYGLQKRFDDEVGKRYFITVWVYDNTAYMDKYEGWSRWSFQPEVQFNNTLENTFDVTLHHKNNEKWGVTPIEQVEEFFNVMWNRMKCEYYEKWEYNNGN